jgi:hypothetical protein
VYHNSYKQFIGQKSLYFSFKFTKFHFFLINLIKLWLKCLLVRSCGCAMCYTYYPSMSMKCSKYRIKYTTSFIFLGIILLKYNKYEQIINSPVGCIIFICTLILFILFVHSSALYSLIFICSCGSLNFIKHFYILLILN